MAALSALPARWRWPGALAWLLLAPIGMAQAPSAAPGSALGIGVAGSGHRPALPTVSGTARVREAS